MVLVMGLAVCSCPLPILAKDTELQIGTPLALLNPTSGIEPIQIPYIFRVQNWQTDKPNNLW